jgi:predicted adenine nucleotide alpha hydrolase (AANH) superfamily ATPase
MKWEFGMKINYQKELDKILAGLKSNRNGRPSLLIHSCCAPCSSYVLEYLSEFFDIIVYYYNPNIDPESEYVKRLDEQTRLIDKFNMSSQSNISFVEGDYEREKFLESIKGLEDEPEGGLRCVECFRLRLDRAAAKAAELNCDYFTTTLTVSPYKNADILNEIGKEAGVKFNIKFLTSDFKKRDGYNRSIELSKQYGLYRQDYCGCIYSKNKGTK